LIFSVPLHCDSCEAGSASSGVQFNFDQKLDELEGTGILALYLDPSRKPSVIFVKIKLPSKPLTFDLFLNFPEGLVIIKTCPTEK
jgi:hypothetical protein